MVRKLNTMFGESSFINEYSVILAIFLYVGKYIYIDV